MPPVISDAEPMVSTGNDGVEQLMSEFFGKWGITLLLLPLIPALFCMVGCIERASDASSASISEVEDLPPRLQVDFDSEVNSHLFRVRGDLMLLSNRSLPYLLLNATLLEDGRALSSTRYLMIDLQPGRDHGFEIAKNLRITPGDYACILEISGPLGTSACETRRCQANEPWIEPASMTISGPQQEMPIEVIEPSSQQREAASEQEAQEDESSLSLDESIFRSSDRLMENVSPSRPDRSVNQPVNRLPEQDAELVGSSSSKKYHLPECRYAQKIKADNKISFPSLEEAQAQGYLPCKVCNP